jgi:hypothetical protein
MSRFSVRLAPIGAICAAIKSAPGPPMTLGMRREPEFGGSFGVGGAQTGSSRTPSNSSNDTAPTRRSSIGVSGFEQFSQELPPS